MHTPANGVAHQSGGTYTHSLSLTQYSTPLPSLSATLDTVCLFVSLCVCLCTQTRRSMTNLANLRSASHIGLKRVGKRVRIVGRRGRRVWLPLWCVSVDDHFRSPTVLTEARLTVSLTESGRVGPAWLSHCGVPVPVRRPPLPRRLSLPPPACRGHRVEKETEPETLLLSSAGPGQTQR